MGFNKLNINSVFFIELFIIISIIQNSLLKRMYTPVRELLVFLEAHLIIIIQFDQPAHLGQHFDLC